jgi:hypothetical protein
MACEDPIPKGKTQSHPQEIKGWPTSCCFRISAQGYRAKPDQLGRRRGGLGNGAAGLLVARLF